MKWKILLTMLAAALIAGCVFASGMYDTKGPEITFGEDVPAFTGDTKDNALLQNVKAVDNMDGDVTGSLYIDSVRVSQDGKRATVTYVATDSKQNVSKASQFLEKGKNNKKTEENKENKEKETTAKETTEEETTEEETTEEETTEEETTEEETTEEETTEEEAKESSEEEDDDKPVLILSDTEDTIGVHDTFDFDSYVKNMDDDKDNEDTLSGRLRITGDYRTEEPGEYDLVFYFTDTDGNKSNEVEFTLIRE